MADNTFHTTTQDIRKAESHASHVKNGQTPKDSNISAMKSIVDQNTDKKTQIENTKANLPLPDQPPRASDWNTADQRAVNVGSGRISGGSHVNSALREPAAAGSSVRESAEEMHKNTQPTSKVGRQGIENLEGLPRDALSR